MEECYIYKPATLLKVVLTHGRFSRFLNYKCHQIAQSIINVIKTFIETFI